MTTGKAARAASFWARVTKHRDTNGYHPTWPLWTRVLITHWDSLKIPNRVWECACGDGSMSEVLTEKAEVISTDKFDYGYGQTGVDFLEASQSLAPAIVTNPPYESAIQFVEHALSLPSVEVVAMLLKSEFGNAYGRFHLLHHKYEIGIVGLMPNVLNGYRYKYFHSWFIWYPGKPEKVAIKKYVLIPHQAIVDSGFRRIG